MTRFAPAKRVFCLMVGKKWGRGEAFFVRIGSEEKNIIFGGGGCRALRDASKDTSFRLEGENYI